MTDTTNDTRQPATVDGVVQTLAAIPHALTRSEIAARLRGGNSSRLAAVSDAIREGAVKPVTMRGLKRYRPA